MKAAFELAELRLLSPMFIKQLFTSLGLGGEAMKAVALLKQRGSMQPHASTEGATAVSVQSLLGPASQGLNPQC